MNQQTEAISRSTVHRHNVEFAIDALRTMLKLEDSSLIQGTNKHKKTFSKLTLSYMLSFIISEVYFVISEAGTSSCLFLS
ncbi:hypothetical protein Taro_022938 [Colocasia esculenta]|uniref:Uncharacterized protein n=1 Tax=Colocasia esculenta TaxID=4460 RepID=A0A843V6U1_COLES|nr:hypothetical protein [Colocasia esculenta]